MMMHTLTPEKVKRKGMNALTRELGVAGMVQFMQQFSSGYGDYTKARHRFTGQLSVDDVWDELKNINKRERVSQ